MTDVDIDSINPNPIVVVEPQQSIIEVVSNISQTIEIKEETQSIQVGVQEPLNIAVQEIKVLNVAVGNITTNAESAKTLIAPMQCFEDISALQIVRLVSSNQIAIAKNNGIEDEALAIGIALAAGLAGSFVPVQLFGRVEDPFFNFAPNAFLFLGTNGNLTTFYGNPNEYRVLLAQSLGPGAIFLNIKEPIQI